MNELDSLKFSNRFAELPEDLFHKQNWSPFDKPKLIHFNEDLAKQLGFPKNLAQKERRRTGSAPKHRGSSSG